MKSPYKNGSVLSDEEFEEVIYGNDFEAVTPKNIVDQSRWHTHFEQVFMNKDWEYYIRIEWARGSTEYQECDLDATVTNVSPQPVATVEFYEIEDDADES